MEDVNISGWKSKDFYLVAVCLAAGCTLSSLEKASGNFVLFVLKESPAKCERIISSHWNGKLKVSSRRLIEAINEVKTRLHNGM